MAIIPVSYAKLIGSPGWEVEGYVRRERAQRYNATSSTYLVECYGTITRTADAFTIEQNAWTGLLGETIPGGYRQRLLWGEDARVVKAVFPMIVGSAPPPDPGHGMWLHYDTQGRLMMMPISDQAGAGFVPQGATYDISTQWASEHNDRTDGRRLENV